MKRRYTRLISSSFCPYIQSCDSKKYLNTRHNVGSEGNPLFNKPIACRCRKLCRPKDRISSLVTHLLKRAIITNISKSERRCLKLPLPVLRYSGTEFTNFLNCTMILLSGQTKCFSFIVNAEKCILDI